MVAVSIPTVVRQTFQPARCGYTLRVISETLYSPEYITSKHTQKLYHDHTMEFAIAYYIHTISILFPYTISNAISMKIGFPTISNEDPCYFRSKDLEKPAYRRSTSLYKCLAILSATARAVLRDVMNIINCK